MKAATDRRKVSKDNNVSPSLSNNRPNNNRSSSPAASSSSSSSTSDGVIESSSSTPQPQPQSQMIPPPQQQQLQQQYHYHHQQQQQQPFIMPPWTPWTPNIQQQQQQISPSAYIGGNGYNNNGSRRHGIITVDDTGMIVHDDDEDISIPSIPDDVPPSPYSPPPASLFSNGDEFPTYNTKSIRKQQQQQRQSEKQPLDELRVLHPNAMHYHQQGNHQNNNYNNNNNTNNNISVPSDEKKMNQSQYNRQQLLPTVLYLKKDLEDSRTAMHLLQQENKALSKECDTFQNEIHAWKEQYNTAIATKEEMIVQLRQEIQQMQTESIQMKQAFDKERAVLTVTKEDVERLSNKLEVSLAANQRLEMTNVELKQEIEMKSTEMKTIRTTLKEQSQTAAQKLKETTSSYEEKVHKLKEECQSLTIETDRLKAMHYEVQQRRSKDIASTEETYRAEITNLRTELVDAQQMIHDLQRNKTNMEGEIHKRDDMIQSLRNEITDIRASNTTNEETIKQLNGTLADATEREEKLLSDFANEKKKLQDEMDQLSRTLQNTIMEKDTTQQSLTQALETSYAKYSEMRTNKEKLEKELKEIKTTLGTTSSSNNSKNSPISVQIIERNNELEKEIEQLKISLSKMSSKCNELRAEKAALQKKVTNGVPNGNSTPREQQQQPKDPKIFKFDQMDSNNNEVHQNDDEMIPNRLERIRDAAERATLAKEHRRELARLKLEHEKEMKQLSLRQEQDIKDVFEEAKAEVTARSRELRRHLQNEYETKIAMLERRYQADLARMQRECDKNTAVAEEAMQAAASEVSAINEQLDKEISIRETLKGTIRELEQKLVTEQQKNKLSANLMISRKQWQRDTNNLLVSIQQECNSVFNQNLLRTGTDSPRSVTIVNNTPNTHSNNHDDNNDEGNNSSKADDDLDKSLQLNDSYLSRIADGTAALSTSMSHVAFPIHRTPWKVRKNDAATSGADGGIIQKTTSYNSPLDVSQALDETEALVRSLVAK